MNKPCCPTCGREVKISECICYEEGRKRIVASFPCHHWNHPAPVVYNVPTSMDNNTIMKEYIAYFEEWVEEDKVQFIFPTHADIYLD